METFESNNPKSFYAIRCKLADLKKIAGRNYYEYYVGPFTVIIYTYELPDTPPAEPDFILKHKTVSVVVNEKTKSEVTSLINLRDDPRFKDYLPIQYDVIESPNGRLNLSDGRNMPIPYLCELICYLHRLSNLTAFM